VNRRPTALWNAAVTSTVTPAISLAVKASEQAHVFPEITSQLGAQGSGLLVSYRHA
jgi:hypothetical protein